MEKRKKKKHLKDEFTVLISIDTKEKILIRPFSRKGKSKILVEACDHELTNNCIIPFGILDILQKSMTKELHILKLK